MAYLRRLLVGAIGALTLVGAASVGVSAHEGGTHVEFESMTPVTAATVKIANDRGIHGGGLPWVIRSGRGEVDESGNVRIRVRGLVIPVAPLNGTNPVANFSATVSCLTTSGIVNVTTGLFPASPAGDSTIKAKVALPSGCMSPEVFVGTTNAATGAFVWFAESNSEDGED